MNQHSRLSESISRRELIQGAAGVAAGAIAMAAADQPCGAADVEYQTRGNIRHSIVQWCFKDHYDLDKLCQVAKQLGCRSVELVDPKEWGTLKKYGLDCAIAGGHLFMQGMNNPKYQPG